MMVGSLLLMADAQVEAGRIGGNLTMLGSATRAGATRHLRVGARTLEINGGSLSQQWAEGLTGVMPRARGLPGAMQEIRRLVVGATMGGDRRQRPTHPQRAATMAGGKHQQRMHPQRAVGTSGEQRATMINGGRGSRAGAASKINGNSKTPGGNLLRRRIARVIPGSSKALLHAARAVAGWKHLLRQVGRRKMLDGGHQQPTVIGSKRFNRSDPRSLRVILDQQQTIGASLLKILPMSGANQRQMERVNGASPLLVDGVDPMQRPARQSQPPLPGKRRVGGRLSQNSRPGRAAGRGASSHPLPRARSAASRNSLLPMMAGRVPV